MLNCLNDAGSIGEAWISILREIMANGTERVYNDMPGVYAPVREIFGLSIAVTSPGLPDPIIEKYMLREEYDWMEDNFTRIGSVPALNNERSYAGRLYQYMGGKDQLNWVTERLRAEISTRSAAITTFEPLWDDSYIPCVSMLDFQKIDGKLHMYAYCRALDFGTKAYVNMVMLYKILARVSENAGMDCGGMTLVIKSAHVYEKQYERVRNILISENAI